MRERTPRDWVAGVLGWTPGSEDQRVAVAAAVEAWEADRALIARLACPSCGEVGVGASGRPDVHSCYDRAALHAQQIAERDARIAELTAQRDALVPLAKAFCAFDTGYDSSLDLHDLHALCKRAVDDVRVAVYYRWYEHPPTRAVLAAIEEERETATKEDGK